MGNVFFQPPLGSVEITVAGIPCSRPARFGAETLPSKSTHQKPCSALDLVSPICFPTLSRGGRRRAPSVRADSQPRTVPQASLQDGRLVPATAAEATHSQHWLQRLISPPCSLLDAVQCSPSLRGPGTMDSVSACPLAVRTVSFRALMCHLPWRPLLVGS